jgi:hypothetical protein
MKYEARLSIFPRNGNEPTIGSQGRHHGRRFPLTAGAVNSLRRRAVRPTSRPIRRSWFHVRYMIRQEIGAISGKKITAATTT